MRKVKALFGAVIIISFIAFISYGILRDKKKMYEFYSSELNTVIVAVEGNWSGGRSYDYITKDQVKINLLRDKSLEVGDSIVKKKDSWKFTRYSKNSYQQIRVEEYNIEQ